MGRPGGGEELKPSEQESRGARARCPLRQSAETGEAEMAGSGEVRLIGAWPSSFVMRPRIALNLKKVEYEYVAETLNPKSDLLLESNPVHKKVPVLLHNGKPVCESLIIVQYIDEAWSSGDSILPADAHDRAIARFWAAYVDDKWFPSSFMGLMKAQTDEEKASCVEQMVVGLQLLEEAFGTCSKGKPFFGGDTLGYLDIALGSFMGWIRAMENMSGMQILDEAKTPQLAAWALRFCTDEAVKEVLPETEKLVEFAQTRMGMSKGAPEK